MHFYIRHAKLTDAKAIAQVHVTGWQQSYKDILSSDYLANISYEERLKQRIHLLKQYQHHTIYLVATVQGEVVGFCDAGPSCEIVSAKGEIYAIYLLDQFKRQGIGSALWNNACQHLTEKKLNPFIVWVLKDNSPARQFYEERGGAKAQEKMVIIGNHSYQEVCYTFNTDLNFYQTL